MDLLSIAIALVAFGLVLLLIDGLVSLLVAAYLLYALLRGERL